MIKKISITDVLQLDVSKRIDLVEDVWDSIAAIPKAVRLTAEQKEELEKRLKSYRNDPSAGSPWRKVKKRLLSQK